MIGVKVSNSTSIRLRVESIEFVVTGPVAKIEAMKILLNDINASCICTGCFKLGLEQYIEFSNNLDIIL